MRVRVILLALVILCLTSGYVEADFLYNRISPKREDLAELNLKCIPGRTVIRVEEQNFAAEKSSSSEEDYVANDGRRNHMNFSPKEEYCQVCVCSVEGTDEYCSRRPAMNVNECMRMATLMDRFNKNMPFEHERDLAHRIRRDYIWHNDEIPYEAKAHCKRGHSYYSNSINANDTDIDVGSEIESLLDYSNRDICYYCVCSVHGSSVGCISRNPWFCEYYRVIREGNAARDMYRQMFQQDRPTYFRQLSYRLRRTMDSSMFDLLDTVGTASGGPKRCIPFVSEYTDCTDENQCSVCSKCTCTAEGTWSCANINKCDDIFRSSSVDDNDIETALLMMDSEMKRERKKKATSSKFPFVPQPTTQNSILLVQDDDYKINIADEIMDLLRPKRSADYPKENENNTIKFYHTLDEVNEDTLKNINDSGTVIAGKLNVDLPKLSRRAGVLLKDNTSIPLHIEYNKADMYQHINDNKIDASPHREDKYEIHEGIGNYSQRQKDRDLSKVIVKEMKSGIETIGDKHAPVMSNVSFTPENETFVAMTYIAGNLLNKLWNMETDSSETIETEVLKHEKIAELLDLFKEPLTINQELLLKTAIEQLSSAFDKNKDIKNMSLCDQLREVKEFSNLSNFGTEKQTKDCDKGKTEAKEVVGNVNNVINLVKKLEDIQSHMDTLKTSNDESKSKQAIPNKEIPRVIKGITKPNNVFASILEQMTKALLPVKANKKLRNAIKQLNIFGKDYDFDNRYKNIFNIASGNITMTVKDKIVLDYLTHIENSPNCLLHGKKQKNKPKPAPSIEGNILLNLSEFFKMKSLRDLLQLVGPKKTNATQDKETTHVLRSLEPTTEIFTKAIKDKTTNSPISTPNKLTDTKEKLKAHLKTILEDLVEMQNAKGHPKNSDIRITDVLPCIYNILNADKPTKTKDEQEPVNRLSSIFNNLKKELKYASYRRSSLVTDRPKSAIVWERLVKSLNQKQKLTRRTMDKKAPKSFTELKKNMERQESGSNTYKNIAIWADIPPADRLTLLKALDVDVKGYITVLENIKNSLEAGIIPVNKISEFNEFVDNVANNININGKVIQKINKPRFNIVRNLDIRKQKTKGLGYNPAPKQEFLLPKDPIAFNTKITRDQVINQLIKNRINMYIRIKETEGNDLRDDINYGIAKKINLYLEGGNYGLARELYNIFANRQKNFEAPSDLYSEPVTLNANKYLGPGSFLDKEPLIQFEEAKTRRASLVNQNHLIQQLINMKNLME